MTSQRVALAAVAGAHGIRGEVRLKLFAESLDSLARHRNVQVGDRQLTLQVVTGSGKAPIARFAEITDRTAAEALRGELVEVPRAALPPLGEGEYYHADLIGLSCEGPDGECLGSIVGVDNYGAGDILEIERPGGGRFLVPFRDGIADLRDGRMVIDPGFLV